MDAKILELVTKVEEGYSSLDTSMWHVDSDIDVDQLEAGRTAFRELVQMCISEIERLQAVNKSLLSFVEMVSQKDYPEWLVSYRTYKLRAEAKEILDSNTAIAAVRET